MELERRNRISDLYHAALARTLEERGAFLNEACDGDDDLRQEVESLLRYGSASSRFLETPAVAVVGGTSVRAPMVNRQVGSYTIVAPLGAGGMGEVYRARDTKLGRDVAIKILPPHFTTDPERRARFAREARLLATLNHPHIGAIYGLEEAAGVTALVLELVEGPTLADRLAGGRLPVADALAIARQIAEALDEAHEKGIVHRDLKPANIVLQGVVGPVAGDVRAKVLDFGLAKPIATDSRHDLTQSPSSLDGTAEGRILGTPAYMSPEQARGQAVDKRTDVWAFGCVLYEMLAGRRAFDADTISDTFVSILERDPDWAALPADTPAAIRTLLDRCLRKDPRKRLHDIADALIELNDGAKLSVSTGSPAYVPSIISRRNRPRVAWVAGAFVIGVLLTAGTLAFLSRRSVPHVDTSSELGMTPPPGLRLKTNVAFALAPDGKHMAMVAGTDSAPWALWVRSIESGAFHRLPGTEDAMTPFWSPDSRRIGFIAGLKLKTIAVDGGAPSEVGDAVGGASGGGGSWNRDGIIVFKAAAGHLQKVSAGGGTPTPVTVLGEGEATHRWPWFLPDGQHFLFLALGKGPPQLRVGSLSSTRSAPLGAIRTDAVYASGHLLFGNDALMAQPFDLRSRQLTGEPISLNVHVPVMASQSPGKIALTASETGLLAFRERVPIPQQLTWVDRKGNRVGTVGEPGGYLNLRLSSDDLDVAFSSREDIWVINLARGDLKRITTNSAADHDPIWSFNGKDIIFNSNPTGSFSLFRRPSDASGSDELLAQVEKGYDMWAPDWSLDSRWVIFCTDPADLAVLDLQGTSKLTTWKTRFVEESPGFSPNGRFVVFNSDETGRHEVYVRPFPYEDRTYKISQHGGWSPRWRSDGEIFFLSLDGRMMSARVSVANLSQRATMQELFRTDLAPGNSHPFDVTKDGQRFLIPMSSQTPALAPITVMTNWTARLAR